MDIVRNKQSNTVKGHAVIDLRRQAARPRHRDVRREAPRFQSREPDAKGLDVSRQLKTKGALNIGICDDDIRLGLAAQKLGRDIDGFDSEVIKRETVDLRQIHRKKTQKDVCFEQPKKEKEIAYHRPRQKKEKSDALRLILMEAFGSKMKKAFSLSLAMTFTFLILPIGMIAYKGLRDRSLIEQIGKSAYGNLKDAQASIESADVPAASKNFDLAYENFVLAREKLEDVGGTAGNILSFVPGISKIESGKKLASAGEHMSLAGKDLTSAISLMMDHKDDLKGAFANSEDAKVSQMSLTQMVFYMQSKLESANEHLRLTKENLDGVDPNDIPGEERQKISMLKEAIPEINESLGGFLKYTDVFLEILGHNGQRKYLILFENNHEMRATGGFIGTYGIVKVDDGKIENIKIDGIYDPDGQLKERIIPPEPIQKMSATWSMHDANWWPDFPTSAEKIAWFYEKTGGPSVDGIMAITPTVTKKLLEITGPIDMPEYGVVINSENFMAEIQTQVEVKYDKTENKPKKILADMTPKLLNKVFSSSPGDWKKILSVFSSSLKERQLMFYSFNYNIERLISDMGWSGEILPARKDYLSVVNTNISGFKTDGVISQKITHLAEIQDDGSIINTVTIQRKHNGGDGSMDWHNAVNCDWMRVYVPSGSELIAAEGFTREFVTPPLDYDRLGFKHDPQVKMMEDGYEIDDSSATRIYKEKDKTVFANWVYVSPGETATVTYKYLLPFRLDFDGRTKPADTYSIFFQKQAGDENSYVHSSVMGLRNYEYVYKYPEDMVTNSGGWDGEEPLKSDVFRALVVKNKD